MLFKNKTIAIHGQRRIGKTSLLLRLEETLRLDHFIPVYFPLQSLSVKPLGSVLADLADLITAKLEDILQIGLDELDLGAFDDNGRYFRRRFLPYVYRIIRKDTRIVLLIDEFDAMSYRGSEEMPSSSAGKALIPFIDRLLATDDRLHFIFAVGLRRDELTRDVQRILETSLRESVWLLEEGGAWELILQAHRNGTLSLCDDTVRRILEFTNSHPYLIQLLCQTIWDRAYAHESISKRIEPQHVDSAISIALDKGDYALSSIWDGMEPAERLFSSALCQVSSSNNILRGEDAYRVLQGEDVPIELLPKIERAPFDLVKKRFLETQDFKTYSFEYDLFRRWIRDKRPIRDVLAEYDIRSSEIQQKIDEGRTLLKKGKWADANRKLSEVLEVRPRSYEAFISRAESYIGTRSYLKAIKDLRAAYRINAWVAERPLAKALALYADELRFTDEENALRVCDEALGIFSNEELAKAIRADIWTARGDRLQESGDFLEALQSYQRAGNSQKIAEGRSKIEQRERMLIQSLRRRADDIARLLLDLRLVVDKAALACEQVAAASHDDQARGIWWAAVDVLRQEEFVAHTLLEGFLMFLDENLEMALFKFERNSISINREGQDSAIISNRRVNDSSVDSQIVYTSAMEKTISFLWDATVKARDIHTRVLDSKELAESYKKLGGDGVYKMWCQAALRLSERAMAMRKYWDAMRFVRDSDFMQAKEIIGWISGP